MMYAFRHVVRSGKMEYVMTTELLKGQGRPRERNTEWLSIMLACVIP